MKMASSRVLLLCGWLFGHLSAVVALMSSQGSVRDLAESKGSVEGANYIPGPHFRPGRGGVPVRGVGRGGSPVRVGRDGGVPVRSGGLPMRGGVPMRSSSRGRGGHGGHRP